MCGCGRRRRRTVRWNDQVSSGRLLGSFPSRGRSRCGKWAPTFGTIHIAGRLHRIAVYSQGVDHAPEITVLQLPKFKAEATELIGTDGIEELVVYLIGHPVAGDVIQGSGGVRKLRWAAKGKGKRGGARIIYLYVVMAAPIYFIRCYAKNIKTDLTVDEKKQLRQISANLKGAQ